METEKSVRMRTCACCKQEKPATLTHFNKCPNTRDKLHSWCKACKKESARKSYLRRKEVKQRLLSGEEITPDSELVPRGYRYCSDCGRVLKATPENFAPQPENKKYGLTRKCKFCLNLARRVGYAIGRGKPSVARLIATLESKARELRAEYNMASAELLNTGLGQPEAPISSPSDEELTIPKDYPEEMIPY